MQPSDPNYIDLFETTGSSPPLAHFTHLVSAAAGMVETAAPGMVMRHVVHSVGQPPTHLGDPHQRVREPGSLIPLRGSLGTAQALPNVIPRPHPSILDLAADLLQEVKTLTAPDVLLDVDAVCRRYGGCDPRTARGVMWSAGAFREAGKLWIHQSTLLDHERSQANRKGSGSAPATTPRKRRSTTAGPEGIEVNGDDWFLEA